MNRRTFGTFALGLALIASLPPQADAYFRSWGGGSYYWYQSYFYFYYTVPSAGYSYQAAPVSAHFAQARLASPAMPCQHCNDSLVPSYAEFAAYMSSLPMPVQQHYSTGDCPSDNCPPVSQTPSFQVPAMQIQETAPPEVPQIQKQPESCEPCQVELIVPESEAKVHCNGQLLPQTGTQRSFITPKNLQKGKAYTYEFTATTSSGEILRRQVDFRPGEQVRVDFTNHLVETVRK